LLLLAIPLQEQSMKLSQAAFLLVPIAIALSGCDRDASTPSTARTPAQGAASGSTADPANRHPSEGVKPADSIGKSGTVSGLPELGSDASPPTVGDKQADPDKKAKSN
jgi:hypothetical protein